MTTTLRRTAAPVKTDSAELTALDDRGLQAQLRGTYRGDVPSGARANNYQIKCVCHVRTTYKMWMWSFVPTRPEPTDSKVTC